MNICRRMSSWWVELVSMIRTCMNNGLGCCLTKRRSQSVGTVQTASPSNSCQKHVQIDESKRVYLGRNVCVLYWSINSNNFLVTSLYSLPRASICLGHEDNEYGGVSGRKLAIGGLIYSESSSLTLHRQVLVRVSFESLKLIRQSEIEWATARWQRRDQLNYPRKRKLWSEAK